MRRAQNARRAAQRAAGAGGLVDDFLALRSRGTEVHIVFAAGDPGVEALRLAIDGDTERLLQAGVDILTLEGADHTFNSSRIRRGLIERIIRQVDP